MSRQQTLSAEEVCAYLLENRGFFEKNPATLAALSIPHDIHGTHSLIEQQVSTLRGQNETLRRHVTELLENARHNDQLFEKTRKLSLCLSQSPSFNEQVHTLKKVLVEDFKAEGYGLILFDHPHLSPSSALQVMDSNLAREQAPGLMSIEQVFCGHLREAEYQFLFPDDYKAIRSAIIIPIKETDLTACIALGSQDENRFHPKLGTLFAEYIGEIVGASLSKALTHTLS
ncbi:MAG: DUF484 family protein [Gammaproteobacteria bacterium]|nr:DUF484 family protein [Gammaproteobacteria bacterium]